MSAGTDWLEAQAEGLGREKAAGGVTTALLWFGGVTALGLGAALAVGGEIAPEAGWIATKLARIGVTAGPVLACGALAIGMAWTTRLLRKQSGQLATSLAHGQILARLAKDFTGLRENIARVQLEFADIQQANRQLLNLVRQQAQASTENEPTKDAMFRLAASMDQLGARLETRVRALFDGLEKRVDGFDRRLEETSKVQRDELGRLEERLTIAATLAQSSREEIPYVDGAPASSDEETTRAGGPARAADEPTPVDEPVVELKPQEEWLDIQVELDISQDDFSRLDFGQKAVITTDAYRDREYKGEIVEISPEADRQKATVQVKVQILEPNALLRPEMNANVAFLAPEAPTGGQQQKPVASIRVPASAVRDGQVFLYVNGKVVARQVEVRRTRSGEAEVVNGLSGGEDLIVNPPEGLSDGDEVTREGQP